jgi:predicted peptidase
MLLRLCALLLAPVLMNASSETQEPQFLNRTVTSNGVVYRYVVSVPAGWSADRAWPIILFLHGSNERGEDGIVQSKVGLGLAVRNHPERFPAIVVMPQCRRDADWRTPDMEAQILAALDASMKEFHGDPRRVYLTGFSMGGYGTWSLAAKYPKRFAAIVLVAAGIQWPTPRQITDAEPYAAIARKVAGIPIWVFHGNADRNVFVTESREMVKLLRELRADVRYTEYDGVAHESWDRAYGEPELPVWLFHQSLNGQ